MKRKSEATRRRYLGPVLGGALAAFAAVPAHAGSFGICGVQARIASMEELALFGAGSRKITSEVDPGQIRSNSFPTLVTLEVRSARLIDGRGDCERMSASGKPTRFILTQPSEQMRVGADVTLMWEYFIDVTPDGNVYQERWTLVSPER